MFLISQLSFEALYAPEGLIRIRPFQELDFELTKYYFHLGAVRLNDKLLPIDTELSIPPGEFVQVFSLESFSLSRRVFAQIGQCSELFNQGVELIHSPTIDPGYADSVLSLGLRNNLEQAVVIRPGARIGKAIFFDISDTILDSHDLVRQKIESAEDKIKRKASERMLELGVEFQGPDAGPMGISEPK